MKLKHPAAIFILFTCLSSCSPLKNMSRDRVINEVVQAEKDFSAMAAQKSIAEAFWFFADSSAVIKRGNNDSLIRGKDAIRQFYSGQKTKATVQWAPDFVDVSASSDLAYTYGTYTWQLTDSNGNQRKITGIFHTVWKKQKDGSWKYVWD